MAPQPDPAETVPLSPSVRQLRAAYLEPGQPRYWAIRAAFESAHGKLVEESYAQVIVAAVVLVRGKAGYKIRLDYDSGRAPSAELAAILRELRLAEREKSALLQKKAQQIFAQKIYTLISHLFAVWDSISTPGSTGRAGEQLNDAVAAAKTELKSATDYADAAAHKSALTWYLWGLPVGALIGGLIIVAIWTFPRIFAGQEEINVTSQVGLSLAFGSIGAIVSVMVRITRGTNVDVRQPGRTITLVAGAFRPIIGAVFGAMFYVLIAGGLLPLEPGDGVNTGLFFAGLAFLAGFSERWAQDTIVQSTPALAAPADGQPPAAG